jgi:hypothetical protein
MHLEFIQGSAILNRKKNTISIFILIHAYILSQANQNREDRAFVR